MSDEPTASELQHTLMRDWALRRAQDDELIAGFATTTPFHAETLAAAALSNGTVEVTSAITGTIYTLEVEPGVEADGSVTAYLSKVNGEEPDSYWWRGKVTTYSGQHTLRPGGLNNTILVTPIG